MVRLGLRLQHIGSEILISFHGQLDVSPVAEDPPVVPTMLLLAAHYACKIKSGGIQKKQRVHDLDCPDGLLRKIVASVGK